jgi:hypothetical protein
MRARPGWISAVQAYTERVRVQPASLPPLRAARRPPTAAEPLPSSRPLRGRLLRRRRFRCRPFLFRPVRLLRASVRARPRAAAAAYRDAIRARPRGAAAAYRDAGWAAASSAARMHALPLRASRFRASRGAVNRPCARLKQMNEMNWSWVAQLQYTTWLVMTSWRSSGGSH